METTRHKHDWLIRPLLNYQQWKKGSRIEGLEENVIFKTSLKFSSWIFKNSINSLQGGTSARDLLKYKVGEAMRGTMFATCEEIILLFPLHLSQYNFGYNSNFPP